MVVFEALQCNPGRLEAPPSGEVPRCRIYGGTRQEIRIAGVRWAKMTTTSLGVKYRLGNDMVKLDKGEGKMRNESADCTTCIASPPP